MQSFHIETERLLITEFNEGMVESVHLNSLDEDTRRFVPDEVFETVDEAQETVLFLMDCYEGDSGPFVFPVLTKSGNENIGYVQAVPTDDGWEIGFKVAKKYSGNGYATEAVKGFLPIIMKHLEIEEMQGICVQENIASCRVMEKCGFELEYKGMGEYQEKMREICRYSYKLLQIGER